MIASPRGFMRFGMVALNMKPITVIYDPGCALQPLSLAGGYLRQATKRFSM